MNRSSLLPLLIITCLATAGISAGQTAPKMPLSPSYWRSPSFLKDFNGSYRINASIEPVLSSQERGELVAIQALMAKGERQAALKALRTSQNAHSPAIAFNLGNLQSEEGQLGEAIKSYQKALSLLPSFRRAHQNIAYAYYQNDQAGEAFSHLLKAVTLGSQEGSVYGLLAHCYVQKGQYEPGLVAFRQAQLTQPEVLDWKMGVGLCLDRLGRTGEATAHFESLAREAPESTPIMLQLASLYTAQNQTQKALVKLEHLRRKKQLSAPYEILLGTLYLGDKNARLGSETLRRVMAREDFKDPQAALQAVQYSLSLSLISLSEELSALIKQADLTPTQAQDYDRLQARILLQKDPQSAEALALLQALIARHPTDSHSLYLAGVTLMNQGARQKGLLILEQAIAAAGSHSTPARLKKAELLVEMGRYQEAISALKDALKEADLPEVADYLSAVENLARAQGL